MEKNTFRLKIANQIIEVHSLYKKCSLMCSDYIIDEADNNTKPDIIIDIVPGNIKYENRMSSGNKGKDEGQILFFDPGYLEFFAVQRKLCEAMPQHNTFLMHGAVIAYNGFAYMFTAPSGVGKSTRIRLWLDEYKDSFVINGDKPFIQITADSAIAYGSPWCGKEKWNTNIGLPLKAIFMLERAQDDEENSIHKMGIYDSYTKLLRQVYLPQNQEALSATLKLVKSLEGKVKLFHLRSKPTVEGIRIAYEAAVAEDNK